MKSFGQYIKVMAKINGKDVLPNVKMPRRERKDKGAHRESYETPEASFRQEVFKYFRKKGIRYWRIENSIGGRSVGLPDFLVFHLNKMWWLELKSVDAGYNLKDEQLEFQKLCLLAGVNHLVATKEEDLYIISGETKYDFID